ncbi:MULTISPECIES: hypothetical protein [Kitasatospora]|uniref:hypothetical protein n=1 Tax=Kitasatospora TaxID=2063 RepID=UPI0012FE9D44|nr:MULTISPECIES: hypothetical protein [Kitasatospora]
MSRLWRFTLRAVLPTALGAAVLVGFSALAGQDDGADQARRDIVATALDFNWN